MSISGATWFTAGSSVSVTGNDVSGCSASVMGGSTVYGSNAYGGAISTYVGTYAYGNAYASTNSAIVMQGDTNAQGSVHTYNLNRIWECTASAVVLSSDGSSCYGKLRVKGAC